MIEPSLFSVLSAGEGIDQGLCLTPLYQAAQQEGVRLIRSFFQNNRKLPLFVPLQPNVATKMNEMREELQSKFPHHMLHGQVAERKADGEPLEKKAHVDVPPPPRLAPPPRPLFDMDGGIEFQEEKDVNKDDLERKLKEWFSPAAELLRWKDPNSQPSVKWQEDEQKFPRLVLLARRFLCILPTSAPSERVWSGLGNIITSHSATVDSTIASQKMYLKYNHDLADEVPP